MCVQLIKIAYIIIQCERLLCVAPNRANQQNHVSSECLHDCAAELRAITRVHTHRKRTHMPLAYAAVVDIGLKPPFVDDDDDDGVNGIFFINHTRAWDAFQSTR